MPAPGIPLRPVPRLAIRWIAMAALVLAPGLAAADHAGPVLPPKTGVDWTTWLLIAGAVAAVVLAAWAFLAPDRRDHPGSPASPEGADPRPPTR